MNNLLKSSAIPLVVRIAGMFFSYVFIVVLTRNYGLDVFGLYSIALVIMSIGSVVGRMGVDIAAVKLIPKYLVAQNDFSIARFIFSSRLIVIFLASIVAIVIAFCSEFMSVRFFNKPELHNYIFYFAILILPFSLTQLNAELLRGLGSVSLSMALKGLMVPLVGCILIIFYQRFELDITIYSMYLIIVIAVCGFSYLFTGFIFFKNERVKISDDFCKYLDRKYLAEILKTARPMFLFSASMFLGDWINTLLLGILSTSEEVGVYRVLLRVTGLAVIFLAVVGNVYAPRISAVFSGGDRSYLAIEVMSTTKIIFWISVPGFFILYAFADIFLSMFGVDDQNNKYVLSYYIMLTALTFKVAVGPVSEVLNMTLGQVHLSKTAMIRVFVITVLGIILIPSFGVLGVSIAVFVSTASMELYNAFLVRKLLGFYTFGTLFKIF